MFSNYCWPGFRKTGVLSEVLNNEMCTCNSQKKDMPIYRKGKKHTKEHELEERSVCPLDRGLLTRPWSRGPRTRPPGVGSKHLQGPGKRPNSTHWETVSWRSSLQTFTADLLRRSNVFHFLWVHIVISTNGEELLNESTMCLHACSVLADSLWPRGLQPARLLCPWGSPARTLEWGAVPSSRGSSQPRDWTHISCTAGRFFTAGPQGSLKVVTMCD